MSYTTNDAMETARDAMDSAKGGAKHAATSVWSTLLDVAKVAVGVTTLARSLGLDVLGWTGLRRKTSMVGTLGVFGAGVAVGAGLGVLFAPMSGRATRRWMARNLEGMEREAIDDIKEMGSDIKRVEKKIERKVEKKVSHVADVVKNKVEAAADGMKEMVADDPGNFPRGAILGEPSRGEAAKPSNAREGTREGGKERSTSRPS